MSSISPLFPTTHFSRSFSAAGLLIGLAMGGFFDGILLHQVLQWHHLLSLVENPVVQDMRVQILADGLFHVLMYCVAAVGIGFLWKARRELSIAYAGHNFIGNVLLGFGGWNIVDVGLFHWVLRIHRIRIDASNPLFWDVLWLIVFGVAFVIAGWIVRSKAGPRRPGRRDRNSSMAAGITALVIAAGILAAQPPANMETTVVLFNSNVKAVDILRAIDKVDGRILWADRSATVWAIKLNDQSQARRLYQHGALLVSTSMLAMGCFSWLQV